MGDVVILTEDATEIASGKEDGSRAIVALYARLFAKMGGDYVDFGRLGADEADARLFPAIHSASSGAEVAVFEVGIRR